MPYFVFRVLPEKKLQLVNSFAQYPAAKELCRQLRMAESPKDPSMFRISFAEDEIKAKRLLSEKHKPASPLEEWEA